jgi:hypothetical protein
MKPEGRSVNVQDSGTQPEISEACIARIQDLTAKDEGSDGEIWIAHGGVNPYGLFVRRGGV